jgi:hypothetical protein
VIGEFLVCGTTTLVLFDTGAIGSYITSRFVNILSLPITTRSIPIITSSPLGDIWCTLLYKDVEVVIWDHKFSMDLTVLPSNGIDVILGMDHYPQRGHLHFTETCDFGTPCRDESHL